MLPLEGIKVVDLCNVVMGPYATQILAEYGADVIKVEPPGGDDSRRTGLTQEQNMATLFLGVNRGKRSIVLDLKNPADLEKLYALIRTADVLVHNIRPQKLQALGIDTQTICEQNPQIIYTSLTGFGQDGPYGGRPAYDDVIQGMSGLASLSQRHNQEKPFYLPTIVADKTVGLLAVGAILAAVVKRERYGTGTVVEVPMFESMVAYTLVEHMYGASLPGQNGEMGYPRALSAWRKPFATRDGHICVMPYTDRHWNDLLLATGNDMLVQDSRFQSIAARSEHTAFVYEKLCDILAEKNTAEWLSLLEQLQVPAAKINRPEDLIHDPHLKEVGFFQHIQDEAMGELCFPGTPVLFDGARPHNGIPPRLGQHTREILNEIAVEST